MSQLKLEKRGHTALITISNPPVAAMIIEPIKTFIIDLKLEKTFTKEYSEFHKDTSTTGKGYRTHNNPLSAGGFSISYVALRTFFDKHDPNMISKQFENFQKYRITISEKVAGLNRYWLDLDDQYDAEGFITQSDFNDNNTSTNYKVTYTYKNI